MNMEPKAAPPDDGGERGAFTRPQDTIEQPTAPREEQRVVSEPDRVTTELGSLAAWLIVPVLLLFVVLLAYCLAPAATTEDPGAAPEGAGQRE